jgi:hypothetical protein
MKKIEIISLIFISLLVFIFIFVFIYNDIYSCEFFTKKIKGFPEEPKIEDRIIPKIIFQSHYDLNLIPEYINNQFKKYAPKYERYVFDDNDCIEFFKKEYPENPEILMTFMSLDGPHRCDLWRYAILYKRGGLYLDIKTEVLKPIESIFKRKNNVSYYVLGFFPTLDQKSCYNGILGTYPKNPFFKNLIEKVIYINKTYKFHPKIDYLLFCHQLYNQLKSKSKKKLKYGLNELDGNFNAIILKIDNRKFKNLCNEKNDQKRDRYNKCGFITNGENEIFFKTRDFSYPWK